MDTRATTRGGGGVRGAAGAGAGGSGDGAMTETLLDGHRVDDAADDANDDDGDVIDDEAGGVVRASTMPTLNRRAESAPLYEHSP